MPGKQQKPSRFREGRCSETSGLDGGAVLGLGVGIGQVLHVGVLDQLLGAHSGTEAALGALGVVDPGQALLNGNGTFGADLLTQTAADAAHGTGTGGGSALGHGVTGDDHVPVGFHGNNQVTGADSGTGHAADTQIGRASCRERV